MSQRRTDFDNFAEILERKIRKQIEAEMMFSSEKRNKASESHNKSQGQLDKAVVWGPLMTEIAPIHFTAPEKGLKRYPTPKPLKPRPAHTMNAAQSLSFQFFIKHGAMIANNFTKAELTRAFRTLALRLHPDQGGSAESFQSLLQARQLLSSLI